jgi:hypothetical protein
MNGKADVLPMERCLHAAGVRLALARPVPMRSGAGGRPVEFHLSLSLRCGRPTAWQQINRALKKELQDLIAGLVRGKVLSRDGARALRGEHGMGPRVKQGEGLKEVPP